MIFKIKLMKRKINSIKLKRIPSVFENDLEKNISFKSKHFFIYRNETMNDLNKNIYNFFINK